MLTIPSSGNATEIFRLNDNQRQLQIKSLTLQTKATKVIAGAFSFYNDFNLPTNLRYRLTVGNGLLTSNKIGKALNHVGGTGTVVNSGDYFTIENNGIFHYSSFFITESIDFIFSSDNADSAISVSWWVSFSIETVSKINF